MEKLDKKYLGLFMILLTCIISPIQWYVFPENAIELLAVDMAFLGFFIGIYCPKESEEMTLEYYVKLFIPLLSSYLLYTLICGAYGVLLNKNIHISIVHIKKWINPFSENIGMYSSFTRYTRYFYLIAMAIVLVPFITAWIKKIRRIYLFLGLNILMYLLDFPIFSEIASKSLDSHFSIKSMLMISIWVLIGLEYNSFKEYFNKKRVCIWLGAFSVIFLSLIIIDIPIDYTKDLSFQSNPPTFQFLIFSYMLVLALYMMKDQIHWIIIKLKAEKLLRALGKNSKFIFFYHIFILGLLSIIGESKPAIQHIIDGNVINRYLYYLFGYILSLILLIIINQIKKLLEIKILKREEGYKNNNHGKLWKSIKTFIRSYNEEVLGIIALLVIPLITVLICEILNRGSLPDAISFLMEKPLILKSSYVLLFFIEITLFSIINKVGWTASIVSIAISGLSMVNYYKQILKGDPLLPSDFFSTNAALSIIGNYNIKITSIVILTLLLMIMTIYFALNRKYKIKRIKYRIILGMVGLVCLVSLGRDIMNSDFRTSQGIDFQIWDQKATYSNSGGILAFVSNLEYVKVDKPNNYSKVKVNTIKEAIVEKKVTGDNIKPNIIMIMSEAYSDLMDIADLETNIEVTPFYDSLKEKATWGNFTVSCIGGATANTEYEVLTGNSMAFLPPSSIPYQQYVHKDTENLASILNDQGYISTAIHPNIDTFWARNVVYDYFGFTEFIDIDDFIDPAYFGHFVSDKESFDKIIETYEKNLDKGPQFIFEITMQNHTPYSSLGDGNTVEIGLENIDHAEIINNYLNQLNQSDKDLKELIRYFENRDEPTVVVFFGDHRPNLGGGTYEQLFGSPESEWTNEEVVKYYTTPFMIWSNYDRENEADIEIDASFLSPYLLNKLNLSMPKYFHYLLDLREEIESLDLSYVVDKEGNIYRGDTPDEISLLLENYKILQYDRVFGKNYFEKTD